MVKTRGIKLGVDFVDNLALLFGALVPHRLLVTASREAEVKIIILT